jgi:hypothetical protein
MLGGGDGPVKHPPVFILGAPRCGSTLLYQLMLDYFDFGYISNIHCKFHGAPSIAERVFRPSRRRRPSSFQSDHGRVSGWSSPSECGDYWYRFFPRSPQYATLKSVSPDCVPDLRRSMRAIGSAMQKPVIFKNLPCSLRLGPITAALPESAFIVVQRDRLETAHSILEARFNLYGNYDDWFSVEPPEYESLKRGPVHEQVAVQVQSIHRLIEEARGGSPECFFDVEYEDICRDTHGALEKCRVFLEGHGIAPARTGQVPPTFEIIRPAPIDEKIYADLKGYFERETGGEA